MRPGRARRWKWGADSTRALFASRAFAAGMGLWGAVLGALVIMVLPQALVESLALAPVIARSGLIVQPTLAGGAGLVLGAVCYLLAAGVSAAARHRSEGDWDAENALRDVHPIDPQRDLGPAPLSEDAEAGWPDALEAAAVSSGGTCEAAAAPAPRRVERGCARVTSDPPLPGAAALALLRSIPTSELSMPELVERFAAALHDHRGGLPDGVSLGSEVAEREAALAEALRALAALSEGAPPRVPLRGGEPLQPAVAGLASRRSAQSR